MRGELAAADVSSASESLYLARLKTLIVTIAHASGAPSVRRRVDARVAVQCTKNDVPPPFVPLDIPFSEMQLA